MARIGEVKSVRDAILKEDGFKILLLAHLNIFQIWNTYSEKEQNGGFSDIFLEKDFIAAPYTKYEYIIELKYFSGKDKPLGLLKPPKRRPENNLNNIQKIQESIAQKIEADLF